MARRPLVAVLAVILAALALVVALIRGQADGIPATAAEARTLAPVQPVAAGPVASPQPQPLTPAPAPVIEVATDPVVEVQAPAPAVEDPAKPSAPPPPEPIRGSEAAPTAGKPVAAVDIDWDLRPDPAAPGVFRGEIGATNRSGLASLELEAAPLGEVAILGPATAAGRSLARGGRLAMPLAVRLVPGTGEAAVVVTARITAVSLTRSRVISIPLRQPSSEAMPEPGGPDAKAGQAAVQPGAKPGPMTPVEHTLVGDDGQGVHFMPSTRP